MKGKKEGNGKQTQEGETEGRMNEQKERKALFNVNEVYSLSPTKERESSFKGVKHHSLDS